MCRLIFSIKRLWASVYLTVLLLFVTTVAFCQQAADGKAGITKANEMVRGYFVDGTNLMYAIGAIIGIVGAVKVYQKWSAGDNDVNKVASAWFGSCVFLVVVATVLKSFFGL